MITNETKKLYNIKNNSGLPVKLDDLCIENGRTTAPCRIYGGFANKNKLEAFIANGMKALDEGLQNNKLPN